MPRKRCGLRLGGHGEAVGSSIRRRGESRSGRRRPHRAAPPAMRSTPANCKPLRGCARGYLPIDSCAGSPRVIGANDGDQRIQLSGRRAADDKDQPRGPRSRVRSTGPIRGVLNLRCSGQRRTPLRTAGQQRHRQVDGVAFDDAPNNEPHVGCTPLCLTSAPCDPSAFTVSFTWKPCWGWGSIPVKLGVGLRSIQAGLAAATGVVVLADVDRVGKEGFLPVRSAGGTRT